MTDLRKAAEMLMKALDDGWVERGDNVAIALRQALAQPEQEPVAYLCENAVGYKYFRWKKPTSHYKPIALYTAPPPKQWVGLTDDEIGDVYVAWDNTEGASFADFARLIETKSRSKNNG